MSVASRTPDPSARPTVADAILVLLGAQALSIAWVVVVLIVAYPDGLPDPVSTPVQMLFNLGLWLGYGLGPILMARAGGRPPVKVLGATIRPRDVPAGLALGVAVQLTVLPLLYLVVLRFVDGDPSADARDLLDTAKEPLEMVLLTVSVVIVAPLVEELFFRGLLLGALRRRWGSPAAVAVSAGVFAVVHRQLLPLPGLFVLGVVAALLVIRTGRLGPAWTLHAGFNAATVAVIGFG
jgi:membrane protease YdiL (CAAX protease family)